MGLYEVLLSMSLLGFESMLDKFHMCGLYVCVKSCCKHVHVNMLVKKSPREPMCFRCLMFSFSGPCELLF